MKLYKYESILEWVDSQYMTKSAVDIADSGLPVFSCKPDKSPNTPHGFKDAITDKQTLVRMFAQPGLLIGMPTGSASGLTVVDVDPKNGGDRSVDGLNIPRTRSAQTRSGGMHFYFKDAGIRNSASQLAPGVDIRGEGGYVIVPPSKGYRWLNDDEPADYPSHLMPGSKKGAILKDTGLDIEAIRKGVPAGQRNDLIYRGLCKLRQLNKSLEEAKEWAADAAMNSTPPYTETDTDEMAERVYAEYEPDEDFVTPQERAEAEHRERVARAQEAWENPEVQKIAKSYDILDKFRSELNAAGIVGVDRELKLLFTSGCSRLLDRPISIAIKGPSSAGKSHIMENALIKPLPDHAVKFFTSMSERALIYSQEDYRHTIIAIAEQSGVNSPFLDYIIRTLLSESRIEYETVEKVDGKHVPRKIVKPGPTGSVISTTQPNLHPENETRILSVWIKDTREQTAQVMRSIARDVPEKDFTAWKAYGTWLEGQDNRVWIPYAESLSGQIASLHVRQRRDFKLLLNTIKTVAFMHQRRRDRDHEGRIIATLRDYESARELLNDLLSEGIGATVSKTIRETVAAVKALTVDADPAQEHTTNKAVAAELDIDPSSASTRVKNALEAGYLVDVQEPGRRGRKLTVGGDLPEDVSLLPEPEDMARSYISQEIAAICSIVGQLDVGRKGKADASWLGRLVGRIVGPGSPFDLSVAPLEKPYEDHEHEHLANTSQVTRADQHGSSAEAGKIQDPPDSVQLSNNVTKSPESVTSGGDPRGVQPTNAPAHQIVRTIEPPYHDLSCNPVYPDDSDPGEIEAVADVLHRCAVDYANALLFPDRYNVGHWSEYLEVTGYGFFREEIIAAALEEHGDAIYELRDER